MTAMPAGTDLRGIAVSRHADCDAMASLRSAYISTRRCGILEQFSERAAHWNGFTERAGPVLEQVEIDLAFVRYAPAPRRRDSNRTSRLLRVRMAVPNFVPHLNRESSQTVVEGRVRESPLLTRKISTLANRRTLYYMGW